MNILKYLPILALLIATSSKAAGPPMKISDYPHTNSVSSNKLFIVAAPGSQGTNWNISFGELNAQIISPTNLPAQVWTNDNGLVHPTSNTVPVQIGLNSSGAGNPPGGGVVSTLFIEGDPTIPVGGQLIYGNGGFPLVGVANGNRTQLPNTQIAEIWAYNQNKAGTLGYGIVGYSYAGFAGSTNVGVAGSVERSNGNASPSTGGYFELTDDENTDVLIETSVIILDNKTTGAPLLITRTNNGAGLRPFKVLPDRIHFFGIDYFMPLTNLASGQVFASDGSTPQQIYGITPVTNNSSIRATDASSVSTSFASTGLSVTLAAGATYTFDCYLYVTDTVSADGVKIDFNGGSATANVFVAQINAYDTAPNLFLNVSSLATAASASSFNGIGAFEVHGTIKVNAGGTFIPRFAQVAHTSGTLILLSGSSLRLFQ